MYLPRNRHQRLGPTNPVFRKQILPSHNHITYKASLHHPPTNPLPIAPPPLPHHRPQSHNPPTRHPTPHHLQKHIPPRPHPTLHPEPIPPRPRPHRPLIPLLHPPTSHPPVPNPLARSTSPFPSIADLTPRFPARLHHRISIQEKVPRAQPELPKSRNADSHLAGSVDRRAQCGCDWAKGGGCGSGEGLVEWFGV